MSRKHRQQHQAKRAQLEHYNALETAPTDCWDGIDDEDDAGDHDAQVWAQAPAVAGIEQRGAA